MAGPQSAQINQQIGNYLMGLLEALGANAVNQVNRIGSPEADYSFDPRMRFADAYGNAGLSPAWAEGLGLLTAIGIPDPTDVVMGARVANNASQSLGAVAARADDLPPVPPAIRGHPRFEALRQDALTMESIGQDPSVWRRDTASGLVLPQPGNAAGQRTYDAIRERLTGNEPQILTWARRGLDEGGARWYDSQQILDTAVEAIGDPVEGRALFDFLSEIQAVASAGSTPTNQNARALWLFKQLAEGRPPSRIDLTELPPGLGNVTWSISQRQPFGRFDAGDSPFSDGALKTGSYNQNLSGNLTPATIDRHARRALEVDARLAPPKDAQYTAYADHITDLAQREGVTPAEFQAALWVGAKDFTGVSSGDMFTQVFMNGLQRYATDAGQTLPDAARQFWRGELPMNRILGDDVTADLQQRAARELAKLMTREDDEEGGGDPLTLLDLLSGGGGR